MLSSRGKYAIRALLDLTLHHGEGAVAGRDVAARQNIPPRFLEQILGELKASGLVRSRKGPGGGYTLARPPEQMTLGEVVRVVDGPLAPISCVSVTAYQPCGCPEPERCALRLVWKQARDALAAVLDRTTFADIRDRQAGLTGAADEVLDYVI